MKKKLISTMLSVVMLGSFIPSVMAETNETTNSVWNYSLIESGSEVLYESFPFIVDKVRQNDMKMDLYFQYLKNITSDVDVNVKITDASNDKIIINKDLSGTDTIVYMSDVPNDKIYCIEVTENVGGQVKNYTKYLETTYSPADFPVNMQLGDTTIENNSGESFTHIMYKKVINNEPVDGANISLAETEIVGEETDSNNTRHSVVLPENLNSFYNTLDDDNYYELQMITTDGIADNRFYGYISTYYNGDDMGIFTRDFKLRDTYAIASNYSLNSTYATPLSYNNLIAEAKDYIYYKNYHIDFEMTPERIFRFIPEQTGEYTFETIGNSDTTMQIYVFVDGEEDSVSNPITSGGVGQNAKTSYGWYIDPTSDVDKYEVFIVINYDNDVTHSAFRVIKEGNYVTDDHPNYFDEILAETADGNYSSNTNENCWLNYGGDVDLFAYQVNSGYGYLHFITKEVDEVPPDDKTPVYNFDLIANIYEEGEDCNMDYENYWLQSTISALNLNDEDDNNFYQNTQYEPSRVNFNNGTYYIEVQRQNTSIPTYSDDEDYYTIMSDSCAYLMNFYDPMLKDQYENAASATYGNNAPLFATPINFMNGTQTITDLTIHKNDSDYFAFTTGSSGGDISVEVDCENLPYVYYLSLHDSDVITTTVKDNGNLSIGNIVNIGQTTQTGSVCSLTYDGLEPNHLYYLRVTRNSGTQYSPYHLFDVSVTFETSDVPSAVLENNVSLSHTVGNNITSTAAFLTTVMQNLTCKINGVDVADATAQADVQLYYNNNVLTADMVNVMSAGTYNIVAKYQGVEATGGTITLTVSDAPPIVEDDIVEIVGIEKVYSGRNYFDWVAVAKMIANVRLSREGRTLSTLNMTAVAKAIKGNDNYRNRGTLDEAAEAANYVYCEASGMQNGDFDVDTITANDFEDEMYFMIENDMGVIIQLKSVTAPDDMEQARYLFVCGVNATTHEVKIIDPTITIDNGNVGEWISISTLISGGYENNSNLVYSGCVIDFSF